MMSCVHGCVVSGSGNQVRFFDLLSFVSSWHDPPLALTLWVCRFLHVEKHQNPQFFMLTNDCCHLAFLFTWLRMSTFESGPSLPRVPGIVFAPSFLQDGTCEHDSREPGAGSRAQCSANPAPGTLDKVNGDAPDARSAVPSFDQRWRGQ